jgi:hypothetical protein
MKELREVTRVTIALYGKDNFPLAEVKLPETYVRDLPVLFEGASKLWPAITVDEVLRAVLRFGVKQTRDRIARRQPLTSGLPFDVAPLGEKHGHAKTDPVGNPAGA